MMSEELDLVTLVDEDGNEVTMEVLDYFFYEGKEYAVMTEYVEGGCDCDAESCEGCQQKDAFIMKVQPVGDDEEEFVPIEDDELMEKLIDFVNNDLYAGDDAEYGEYDDEEEEDEE